MRHHNQLDVDKRREVQLLLLREGYTQDEARMAAAECTMPQIDEMLERMRERAMRFPERQILPPGAADLHDLKTKRQKAALDAEEEAYYVKCDQLAATMAQSFSLPEMPLAVMLALLNAMEAGGHDRLAAIQDLIKHLTLMRQVAEDQRAERGR